MKIITIILIVLVSVSCRQTVTKKHTVSVPEIRNQCPYLRIDTISDVIKYMYYSENTEDSKPDSIMYFYTETKEYSIYYYHNNCQGVFCKSYYPNGNLSQINFYYENPLKGDTVSIWYFENGNIRDIETIKNDSMPYPRKSVTYYPNGKIAVVGTMDFHPDGVNVVSCDTWYFYDRIDGTLKRKDYYLLDRSGKDYLITTTYDKEGNVIKEEKEIILWD